MKRRSEKRAEKREAGKNLLRMLRANPGLMPPRWRGMRRAYTAPTRITVYAQLVCSTPGYSGRPTL